MITSKNDLIAFKQADKLALGRTRAKPLRSDYIWRYEIALREAEYNYNCRKNLYGRILAKFWHRKRMAYFKQKVWFALPLNVFDMGLSIAHAGNIIVNHHARVGKFCRMQEGINIGATNGSDRAPVIGDYVYIGAGAKIIGNITIADHCAIGANAVVVKSITEPGTTWGGIPARKISDNNSHSNLNQGIFAGPDGDGGK